MTTRTRVLIAMRAFVLVLGTAALWLVRDGMNPDGVAYLDASDVYLAGGWPAAGTGYWSPLYPTLLALGRLIGGTDAARELAVAQAVNWALFLLAFAALEMLVRSVRQATAARSAGAPPNDTTWMVLAYALFTWATVGWIRVWMLTPDMCLTAIALATAAVCVRIASGNGGRGSVVGLGALLGLGYLTKAAFFPVGFVVLATLAIVMRRAGGVPKALVAGAIFLAISSPQVAYVSRLKGSPTFGDVGRLTYLWYIADVPGAVSSSFPLPAELPSPSRTGQSLARLDPGRDGPPAVYAIDAPIPGTLPIWYDAGHWYRGVVAPLYAGRIVRAVVRYTRDYLEMFGFLVVGGLAAAFAGPVSRRAVTVMRPAPLLVVPALAALAMYALVLVQARYAAPFALLLVAGLVPPWATDDLTRRVRTGFMVGALAALPLVLHEVRVDRAYWGGSENARATLVAALAARGVGPGTRLGFIGEAYDAYWARHGRMRFVSLLPTAEAGRFWRLDAAGREAALDRMRAAGAQVVLAETPAQGVSTAGWAPLPSAGVPRPALMIFEPDAR
jgi:hypothetical protein